MFDGSIAANIGFLIGLLICLPVAFLVELLWDRFSCRRAYSRRKAQLIEYHITDDVFAFTSGVVKFSSPLNKIASHYRLADDVLFLYDACLRFNLFCSKQPFEAQCIPDWKFHGVERAELAAVLEKAGLKKSLHERLGVRKTVMWLLCMLVPLVLMSVVVCNKSISRSKNVFQQHLGGVELNRVFFQIGDEGAKESDNPYFDYWEKYGNFVQRFVARRMLPLNFEKYEYFFKDGGNSGGRKIGIAGTVGDRVCYARMPSGEVVLYNREQWERYKSQQKPEGYYPPSACAEWLEKIRLLVPELRKSAQDRLAKKIHK